MKIRLIMISAVMLSVLLAVLSGMDALARTAESGEDGGQDFRFRGYVGGMMLHTGYISSPGFTIGVNDGAGGIPVRVKGAAFGIGGQVKFAFGTETDMIRIGSEGHSSSVSYRPSPSYAHTGWGGILVDYIRHTKGRIHPYIGVTVGGGGVKNHIIADGSTSDFVSEPCAAMRKYTFMAAAPFIGVEIGLTPKLSLSVKADWLFNLTGRQPDFSSGPRLYVGIMFNRLQK